MMARYTRKPIDLIALLQQNALGAATPEMDLVRQLNTELQQILQLEKPDLCKVSRIHQGEVMILCGSVAWATRVRMLREQILSNFRAKVSPELRRIEIDVNPAMQLHYQTAAANPPVHEVKQISKTAADYLSAVAEHADPVVAEKLRKLAGLATGPKKPADES